MTKTKNIWFVIVNPHAGSGKTMSKWPSGQQRLDQAGLRYNAVLTTHRAHATTLAYFAATRGYRKILAVGGDGTIHEVFNGVLNWCAETGTDPSEFYLGVAPIGSGNDWIKSLNVPHDVRTVADLLLSGSFTREDVVRLDFHDGKTSYMANIGGLGFDSHVCVRVNAQKEAGMRNKLIYVNALRHTIFHLSSINVMVKADGKEVFSGQCYSIALGNGKYSGSGMCQVPLARMDDGLIDIMIVPKLPLKTILKELPRIFNKTVHESENVLYFKGRELEIIPLDGKSADVVEVDGEIEGNLPVRIYATGQQINAIAGRDEAQDHQD